MKRTLVPTGWLLLFGACLPLVLGGCADADQTLGSGSLAASREPLERYYEPINERYLELRGNTNFQWSVSHGTYMRSLTNPSTQSLMGDLTDSNIDILEAYAWDMLATWEGWLDAATPIPEDQRKAQ